MTASDRRRTFGAPSTRWLEDTTSVRVRFQEVDSMHVVWHGHYLTYFEEGRTAFGRRYGFNYTDFAANGCMAPLVHAEVDFFAPARFDDVLAVRARLHLDQSARLDFTYRIARVADDGVLVLGRTVQVLTTLQGELLLTPPRFYGEFVARWQQAISTDAGG